MSLSQVLTASSTLDHDGAADYDHEIVLEDTTRASPRTSGSGPNSPRLSQVESSLTSPIVDEPLSPRTSDVPGRKRTLREELVRRKYARYQEGRYGCEPGSPLSPAGDDGSLSNSQTKDTRPTSSHTQDTAIAADAPCELDTLYENQRGSFFFGIPLFSHSSLLNFDPSPWSTAALKDSPVDVTTAQPPDPSWTWAWKTWCVDMSGDVDDEGWQYSFSFSKSFAWHGTHVWFHSFVRRRRWLRKRVRRTGHAAKRESLATDDFQSQPDSRRTSTTPSVAHSIASSVALSSGLEEPSSVRTLPALMRALKSGRIDREKIEAADTFLTHASDTDISSLAERIPTVMASLVFQASRGQLLALLTRHYDGVSGGSGSLNDDSKRRDALLPAVRAADAAVRRLEYWSDIKGITRAGESKGAADERQGWGTTWAGVDGSGPSDSRDREV